MADHKFTIDGTTLVRRLRSLYSHWQEHRDELWGSCNAFAVATQPQFPCDTRPHYSKSSSLSIWLLGYDFPETIMVFSDKQIHFLCSQTLSTLLEHNDIFKKSAKEAVDVDVVMHVKSKDDDEITTQMDAILQTIEAQEKSNVLGRIAPETPWGELLKTWTKKIMSSLRLQLCDVTNGLADLFTVKDAAELTNVKKAAYLSASAMKQFVVPRLEKVIQAKKKVSHFSLSRDTRVAILKPDTINVKLKGDHVRLCYPPIFLSGRNFDLRPSVASKYYNLWYDSGSVISCQLGSRYNSYCTNVARSFLIDPDDTQIRAYGVLVKAHEAAVGELMPGNKANAVYKAAYAVVEKEAPEFIPNFKKSVGEGIGIEYRDSRFKLNKKNERILKAGMVLNVSLAFEYMPTKGSRKWSYALLISDTVIVTVKGGEVVTSLSRKALEDVAYELEKEEDERPQVKVEAKRTEGFTTLIRSDNHDTPILVATLSEIEIVNLERVALERKNFDMANVFKDLKKSDVLGIHSKPSTSIDDIKEWLDTSGIKYYDSRLSMNSQDIPKTVTDDDPQNLIDEAKRRKLKAYGKLRAGPSSSSSGAPKRRKLRRSKSI